MSQLNMKASNRAATVTYNSRCVMEESAWKMPELTAAKNITLKYKTRPLLLTKYLGYKL
jgi:hypothetical protein